MKVRDRRRRRHRAIGHGSAVQAAEGAVRLLPPPAAPGSLERKNRSDFGRGEVARQRIEKGLVVQRDRVVNVQFLADRIVVADWRPGVLFIEHTLDTLGGRPAAETGRDELGKTDESGTAEDIVDLWNVVCELDAPRRFA